VAATGSYYTCDVNIYVEEEMIDGVWGASWTKENIWMLVKIFGILFLSIVMIPMYLIERSIKCLKIHRIGR